MTKKQSNRLIEFAKYTMEIFENPDYNKMPYYKYLHTQHWAQLRELKLAEVDYRCQLCYSPKKLHVHHRTYVRLGREKLTDLTVLCKECHDVFHKYRTLDKTPDSK